MTEGWKKGMEGWKKGERIGNQSSNLPILIEKEGILRKS